MLIPKQKMSAQRRKKDIVNSFNAREMEGVEVCV